jgi:hypothetical protein
MDTWVKATVDRVGKGEFRVRCDPPFDELRLTLIESPMGDPDHLNTHRPMGLLERLAEEG